jgi:predicted transcriptional regulator
MAGKKTSALVFRPGAKGLRKVFGELEAAIMECLWTQRHGTVSEVYREMTGQRDIAYTTVKTVMERLADKGYLRCDRRRRAYVYIPTQSREGFLRQVGEAVLSALWQDFSPTIADHLLEETIRQCDVGALNRLQTLLEARRAAGPEPPEPP